MRCAILGFVAGAALLQTRAVLPDPWHLLACALAALVLLLALRGPVRAACAGVLLGFAWAALVAHGALSHALAETDEGRDIELSGTIAGLPHDFGDGLRFQLDVDTVLTRSAAVPPKLALSWYGAAQRVVPGERWRFTVRLQRPHGNANPYGFDYEAWLLGQGVRATGYVRPGASARLDTFVARPAYVVERCRDALRARILAALPGKPYAPVIVALVIGDQRGIEQSDWDVFNRTGISHLVAISGLHITMIVGLVACAASSLWRRSFFTGAQLPLLLPAQKVAALAGAVAALLYVLLAGFGVPAQRTLYMLAVVALALWCGRLSNVSHVLCLALGLVVVLDPWCLLWPGFWLSFGAVGVILYAGAGRVERPAPGQAGWRGALRLAARTQFAVTLGLVPFTLLLFAQVSLIGPIANALAIPVVSFVVTPLALAGSLLPAPLSQPVLLLAHLAVEWLAAALGWLAAMPLAVWSAPVPPPWLFLLALAGTLWMLAPRGWPQRWVGAVSWLPLLTLLPVSPPAGQFSVTAFDIGQGMALLVETENHRLLYDTGPQYAPSQNGATRVLLPYLRARGIHRLDGLIVSHSDTDHAGGALTLLDALEVDWMASSLGAGHPAVRKAKRQRRCLAGQRWEWDGVRFEMLQPGLGSYADPSLKANARSCTLRISAHGRAILLAADIEAAQEAQLLQTAPDKLRADVLLAPHHGSGTSSTPPFLAAVRPEIGVFQVGHRNRYKHPKKEVFARYAALGIRRLRTDESGALRFEFGAALTVSEYRREQARYWHGR